MLMARKRINIGVAMFAGGAVLAIGAPLSIDQIKLASEAAFVSRITWELAAAVVLIGILGHILKASGALDVMVDRLLKLMGDPRWLMVILPGMIGALSVPGGAMMSAPMVDQLGDRTSIEPEHKTGINIIYRHIWYVAFPIIPSMVLAASLAGMTARELALLNVPVLVIGLISSWFILLQRLPGKIKGQWNTKDFGMFFASIMPLLLVIVIYLVVGMSFVLALSVGIGFALINLPCSGEQSLGRRMAITGIDRIKTMVLPGFRPQLLVVVAGVMLFKELLHASSLVTVFASDLVSIGIPLWLLLLVMPMLVGLATGSHEAAVGISIPIFVSLLSPDIFRAGMSLTYISATLGYLISPLHLCMILTREFFNAKFARIYRYTGPVALVMLITALITALIRGL
jgi:integral membrane protein (TIGR00529 family)